MAAPRTTDADRHTAAGEEYEHTAVPAHARKSLLSVAGVWAGFPMCLGNAVFGGLIVYNLGLVQGFWAILTGNLLLFCYVGALSHHAGRTGRSFAQQSAAVFGPRGRAVVSGFLATVVIGWFSYQVGLTGTALHQVLGWTPLWGALLGAAVYIGLTAAGIRALSAVGLLGVPLFLVTAALAFWYAAQDGAGLSQALDFQGHDHGITFWSAVGIVIAGFVDSGTMTADFTRWSRDGRSAVLATFSAFPLSNTVAYLVGGAVVATGGAANPATDGGTYLGLLTGHGAWITALAVLFTLTNLGSVAAHCLYNAALGWSGTTPLRMRPLVVALGVLGSVIALTGVWSSIVSWLQLLGILVPPIGAVLIVQHAADRFRRRPPRPADDVEAPTGGPGSRHAGYVLPALVAWAAGSAAAWALHHTHPGSVDAALGFAVAALVHGGHLWWTRRRPSDGEAATSTPPTAGAGAGRSTADSAEPDPLHV
ncbi:purine-cytosine permease family protein [Streptomyces sp. NBC_00385]|uniref:purine-cytosine permease family protein n=1 Tax=Streptomyces sp. NBC_00385 TaxID=2975733 RepID=UPI002DD9F1DD|nr:cytosine permease [Streptomyces sp. NBC_00385]WRZ02662.1 cytosine permease [Streptomyces sp. NBC_00385]